MFFPAPDQNIIMAALSKHANVKIFSEKLLLLLNRGGEGPGFCSARMFCDSMTPITPWGDSGPPVRTVLTPLALPSR